MNKSELKKELIDDVINQLDSLPENRAWQILNKLSCVDLIDLREAIDKAILNAVKED